MCFLRISCFRRALIWCMKLHSAINLRLNRTLLQRARLGCAARCILCCVWREMRIALPPSNENLKVPLGRCSSAKLWCFQLAKIFFPQHTRRETERRKKLQQCQIPARHLNSQRSCLLVAKYALWSCDYCPGRNPLSAPLEPSPIQARPPQKCSNCADSESFCQGNRRQPKLLEKKHSKLFSILLPFIGLKTKLTYANRALSESRFQLVKFKP
jgi:hypothetical protein